MQHKGSCERATMTADRSEEGCCFYTWPLQPKQTLLYLACSFGLPAPLWKLLWTKQYGAVYLRCQSTQSHIILTVWFPAKWQLHASSFHLLLPCGWLHCQAGETGVCRHTGFSLRLNQVTHSFENKMKWYIKAWLINSKIRLSKSYSKNRIYNMCGLQYV